jgi:hypothetical protein
MSGGNKIPNKAIDVAKEISKEDTRHSRARSGVPRTSVALFNEVREEVAENDVPPKGSSISVPPVRSGSGKKGRGPGVIEGTSSLPAVSKENGQNLSTVNVSKIPSEKQRSYSVLIQELKKSYKEKGLEEKRSASTASNSGSSSNNKELQQVKSDGRDSPQDGDDNKKVGREGDLEKKGNVDGKQKQSPSQTVGLAEEDDGVENDSTSLLENNKKGDGKNVSCPE